MDEPEQPTRENHVESERDRRLANFVLLLIFVVLVGGGIWLTNAMLEQRTLDDCLAQGRRNCAPPIEAPAR
jgi:cytoskeletal protein RodZ